MCTKNKTNEICSHKNCADTNNVFAKTVLTQIMCLCITGRNSMAIQTAENRKITKHKPNCDAINVEFLPLIVDAFGRPSETFITFITNLIRRASDITHIPFSLLLNYWKKRISTNI